MSSYPWRACASLRRAAKRANGFWKRLIGNGSRTSSGSLRRFRRNGSTASRLSGPPMLSTTSAQGLPGLFRASSRTSARRPSGPAFRCAEVAVERKREIPQEELAERRRLERVGAAHDEPVLLGAFEVRELDPERPRRTGCPRRCSMARLSIRPWHIIRMMTSRRRRSSRSRTWPRSIAWPVGARPLRPRLDLARVLHERAPDLADGSRRRTGRDRLPCASCSP